MTIPMKRLSSLNRKPSVRRRGATMVEFALVVPILLAMLLGIMEFGWLAKNNLQLSNAVREGARDAAVGLRTGEIEDRIRQRASGIPGVPGNLAIQLMRDDPDASGYTYDIALGNKAADTDGNIYNDAPTGALIQVQATLPHQSLTGIPFSNGRTLQIAVIMRREQGA